MVVNYKSNYLFPLIFRIPAFTVIICGIIVIGTLSIKSIFGIVLIILGIPFALVRKGTLIKIDEKKLKYYVGLFNIKIGEWIKIESYPYITILHLNLIQSGESNSGLVFSNREKVYRICLLSENHREKLKIADFKDQKVAKKQAVILASNLESTLVTYSPK